MKKELMVYMVCGGSDYEGEDLEYLGSVFMNKEDGVKYGESLVNGSYVDCDGNSVKCDYYKIKEVEVN